MMSQKHKYETGALWRGGTAFLIGLFLVLGGCARQLTPFGKARKADTIEAYEEFIRNSPRDPRVRFARDRIEVLRLLEAHKSGNAAMAAPGSVASKPGLAYRAETAGMRQGPWNLTASAPRRSRFILDLYHGTEQPIPHKLILEQQGEQVTYTLQHGSGPNAYYLRTGVPFASFGRLWTVVVAGDVGSYKPSYGRMVSTADYRGNLIIEIDTGIEQLSRTIRLEGSNFEDQNLRDLLRSIAQMHPEDHSMRFLR